MQLIRATIDGEPRVVVQLPDGDHVATVNRHEFEDMPELLAAAEGHEDAIVPGREVTVAPARFLSVVGAPRKVVCIGLNYRPHANEAELPVPDHPLLFPKWATSLAGPLDDIPLPPESTFVDWESELAFVFGRTCRRVRPESASDVVFGYTIGNDVSMRDYQCHTTQFVAGKAWDRSTPLGPALVTSGELGGTAPALAISGALNGVTVQSARTDDLIFNVPELVAYLTTVMTMEPGDVVLTGTPSGVGMAAAPPRSLQDGDVFEVQIEGIGRLRNRFVAEAQALV
jgi:acylpyruvate hydrolase